MTVSVRTAQVGDAEAIRAIYNREVLEGTATFDLVERSVEDHRAWMTAHAGVHPAVVAVDDAAERAAADAILGFGALSPYRDRAAYRTTVEDSVYVRPDAQGRGVGRAILAELCAQASAYGFHSVIARIGESNEGSIALHRACGFEVVGTEREVGRKFGRWLDVVVMQRLI